MMPCFATRYVLCSVCLFLIALVPSDVDAREGDPIAVRNWGDGVVAIETQWNLLVVFGPTAESVAKQRFARSPDQTIVMSASQAIDHWLFRKPNDSLVSWVPVADRFPPSPDAVRVKSIQRAGKTLAWIVMVDGVQIMISTAGVDTPLRDDEMLASQLDLLWVRSVGVPTKDSSAILGQIKHAQPRVVCLDAGDPILNQERVGEVIHIQHNTFAISATELDPTPPTSWVVMPSKPWAMPEGLEALFITMEASCEQSQEVFGKLSIEQLNFKPSNGTHTPRWNAEHMMGRQLLFFSQIYHAQQPAIAVMDFNPKQMPSDYLAAHPTWNGAEEARQMQRVSAFTRRFAYLLEGLDLDAKPPGSRWVLRALLKQMDRHYAEHTANTLKKFDLPDWPQ
ncbi:DinB family protein [Novipirellula artificiosorum]|uniref:DinB superfamily protein n=1 Tax=Novipirellula artificiosorum TaxID=2528016 RepID=A0A5C6D9J0_9BACT|nr:DinB family protein [Novipirellula artificiosorum]TWU33793.1 hypothetical protein Poly41_47910 [Novipirellula artificiosorum]